MLFIWFLISNVIYRFTLRNILCMMMPVLEYYQQVSLWIKKKKGRPLTTYKSHSATYTEKHYRMLIEIIITDKRENSDYVFSFTVSLSL